jgi:CDP-glucose 4,6-dehydratase
MTRAFWHGRRVLVTGHTGFKGSWLALWLETLGAEVHGFALEPPTDPSLFDLAGLDRSIGHEIGDVRDAAALGAAVGRFAPEIVFHLAAQSLVRESYVTPSATYATNVMGTVNLLEAVRASSAARVVVNVTTDKCYDNREWPWAYRETEALGGRDPYSSSKACAELVTAAWRDSFLASAGIAVATARAGNVIGGGDFAADRLLPDFFRALDAGAPLKVRSPTATRPWQHVLEPLSGYLLLAEMLWAQPADFAGPWNFGPGDDDARSVSWIVDRLVAGVEGASWSVDRTPQPHEAGSLRVDSSKARARLGWAPRWPLATALDRTLEWHRAWRDGANIRKVSLAQIARYTADAAAA